MKSMGIQRQIRDEKKNMLNLEKDDDSQRVSHSMLEHE
jgi:RNase P/RNase MRP subunit p29